jgi:hypothetical protein
MYKHMLTLCAALTLSCQAHALKWEHALPATVVKTNTANNTATKTVYVMNIPLTAKQKQRMLTYTKFTTTNNLHTSKLPVRIDLGMNGVPVLDQGQHGACVTFANTAAVDAVLKKGDYISQLCNLELGSSLEQQSYLPSGWMGSSGPYVLNQLLEFGIVSKETQKTQSCAGIKEYPQDDPYNTGNPINLDEFHQLSEPLNNANSAVYWEPVLTPVQRLAWDDAKKDKEAEKTLLKIKRALAKQTHDTQVRLTFSVLLATSHCSAGACGRYHATDDTWALTQAIINDPNPSIGFHEMIITGYDDKAVAIDNEGTTHTGLLMLRNSWGTDVGDQGNFYMTYDYFKQFIFEIQKVIAVQDSI